MTPKGGPKLIATDGPKPVAKHNPTGGWAKLPYKSMYSASTIAAFTDFQLRRVAELDALKLFFLFVARRDRENNVANIGYEAAPPAFCVLWRSKWMGANVRLIVKEDVACRRDGKRGDT